MQTLFLFMKKEKQQGVLNNINKTTFFVSFPDKRVTGILYLYSTSPSLHIPFKQNYTRSNLFINVINPEGNNIFLNLVVYVGS